MILGGISNQRRESGVNSYECVLDCDHRVRVTVTAQNAHLGGYAYCRFDGYKMIVELYTREWRVLCATGCVYGRWCGQNEADAHRVARNHKHNCIVLLDTVTASGGTPRKTLIKKALHTRTVSATLVETEEPPF